jgi:hypothetical protein
MTSPEMPKRAVLHQKTGRLNPVIGSYFFFVLFVPFVVKTPYSFAHTKPQAPGSFT